MALTQGSVVGTSTAKGINVYRTQVADNTVMYTVPEGKMFTGTVMSSNPQSYPIRINSAFLYAGTYWMPEINKFELGPGAVISTGSYSGQFIVAGIERDLV